VKVGFERRRDRTRGVVFVHELEQGVEPHHRRDAPEAEERGERSVSHRAERIADPQHGGPELRHPPESGARVQIGGDEIGQLGKSVRGHRRLVFLVVEGRVGGRSVEGVPPHEDDAVNAVSVGVLEDGARSSEVDAIAVLALLAQVRDRRHVNDRLGPKAAKHLLGGALAYVDHVHGDARRRALPRARVDPHDLVSAPDQLAHDLSREKPRRARHEDSHATSRLLFPSSMSSAMRRFTSPTFSSIVASSSLPSPSNESGCPK
jgi:hypothetical protein